MLQMSGVVLLPTVASRWLEDLDPNTHIEALKVLVKDLNLSGQGNGFRLKIWGCLGRRGFRRSC